jgi:hypothetical protein
MFVTRAGKSRDQEGGFAPDAPFGSGIVTTSSRPDGALSVQEFTSVRAGYQNTQLKAQAVFPIKGSLFGRSLALAVSKLFAALLLMFGYPFNNHSGLKDGWRVTL